MEERELTYFEKKIKPILSYVGFIGAIVFSIAYIVAVLVLIRGFHVDRDLKQIFIFAILNAVVGFAIMQFLKIQGESFAKEIPENKAIIEKFCKSKAHKKKKHSMLWWWLTSTPKDLLSKGLTLGIATFGVIYICIEGSGDYSILGLAAVNLLSFISFGLISLVKTFDFYNNCYIPYILDKNKEE